ncbi:olpB, partial [Symbiodinium natans]
MLNGGNIVDIFQRREDDYEAPATLEVEYFAENGDKVQEIVFVDAHTQPGMGGPRILVSATRVNTMNRAISVLSRKVDNLTTTLRVCRSDYYKELFSLRYGREPLEEHEKYWFMPQAYQDMVSIKELRKRFGTEQEELRKKDREIKELRAKIHQIDALVEDRMEQLVQSKPLAELFRWLARLNDFREAEWEEYIMLLSKAITDKFMEAMGEASEPLSEAAHPAHIDMEKVHLRSRVETAEMEVDALRMKLQAAEMNQQSFAKLLTERKVDIPRSLQRASSKPLSDTGTDTGEPVKRVVSEGPESNVGVEPVRQRKLSMYKPRREDENLRTRSIASTEEGGQGEDTSSVSASWVSRPKMMSPSELENLSGEALEKEENPRILKAKVRELETLAAAWEQEARDQSSKCLELESRNKEAARVQRQRDLAMKDVARSQKRIETLEHELAELQAANAQLRAKLDTQASDSEDGSRTGSHSRRPSSRSDRRSSVEDDRQAKLEKLRNDGDK